MDGLQARGYLAAKCMRAVDVLNYPDICNTGRHTVINVGISWWFLRV
jgi:hypothetical protein